MGEGALRERPAVLLDVRGENPVPELTDGGAKPSGTVRRGAWPGEGAGLAGSHALASPAPVDPAVKAEGMAGIQCRSVDTELNPIWVRWPARVSGYQIGSLGPGGAGPIATYWWPFTKGRGVPVGWAPHWRNMRRGGVKHVRGQSCGLR